MKPARVSTYDDFEERILDRCSDHADVEEEYRELGEVKTVRYPRTDKEASPLEKLNEFVYKESLNEFSSVIT